MVTSRKIEPVRQARDACYALRGFIEADPRWTRGRLRWDHIVVLPNSQVPQHFALPEYPRWRVIDRDDFAQPRRKATKSCWDGIDRPLLTGTGIGQLQIALSGRGLPQRDVVAGRWRTGRRRRPHRAPSRHPGATKLLTRVEVRGERAAERPLWRWSRRGACRTTASASRSSATRTVLRPGSASPKPGRAGSKLTSASSHPRHQMGRAAHPPESSAAATSQFFEHGIARLDARARDEPPTGPALRLHRRRRSPGLRRRLVGPTSRRAEGSRTPAASTSSATRPTRLRPAGHATGAPGAAHPRPEHPATRQIATAFQPLVDHPMRYLGGDGPDVAFVPCARRRHGRRRRPDRVSPRPGLAAPGRRYSPPAAAPRADRPPGRGCRGRTGTASGTPIRSSTVMCSASRPGATGRRPRGQRQGRFRPVARTPLRWTVAGPRSTGLCGDPAFIKQVGGTDLTRRLGIV